MFTTEPTLSLCIVAREVGMSHKSVKSKDFYLFKMQILQQLLDGNFDRRIKFCVILTDFINAKQNSL